MKKCRLPVISISEIILVRCGSSWTKTFLGMIIRSENANPKVYGNAEIGNGKIWSYGSSQEELETNLDEFCWFNLEMYLTQFIDKIPRICSFEFYHN